ncbi:extracellular solute-binding protein [Microbacterium sp. MEC084]|uniref:ABC transporter substrate-binding protein n=1 Tax=unclassified Microbacterium TaxID=2609290 RepID=UPI0009EA1E1E|nr:MULTISPECIES: ABC transporter substrate-binding protein [unclassified Microbacterium]MCD1269388.1 extracellular solute-binding protein [Microbacterium sp. MEC084]
MKKRMRTGAAGMAAAALLLTGCGGAGVAGVAGGEGGEEETSATAVYDEINALSGQERTDRLVELAQEEGELTIYHSNTDLGAVIEAFEETYDITVDATRGNSETVLQKVMSENSAGSLGVDVLENPFKENVIANQQGLFYAYESEFRDAVVDEARMDGWTANYFNVFVVGWNADNVDAEEIPSEIKDFAESTWDGRVALEMNDTDWFAAVSKHYLDQGMSEAEVDGMWAGIAENASVEKGHSAMGDMLAAGKLQIALSIYQHTLDGASEELGAPVQWKREGGGHVGPVVISPTGAGVLKAAEHPAAAMLFMDFMLGEQGQQIMHDNFRVGSVPREDSWIAGVETIPMPLEVATEDFEYWDDKYRELVGG